MDHLLCLTLLFVPIVSSSNHISPFPAFTNYGHHSSNNGRSGPGSYLSGLGGGSDSETYFTGVGEDEGLGNNNGGLSMCLSSYEISEGSIIRTKDSQERGAKFLNESDLGAGGHDECLKLCCRTPHCNVAVFQEKNSGSCYMFDCGSTEDFRCRFTSEINYMSAILRRKEVQVVPQQASHTSSVQQQQHSTSNNQHEAELNQLRRTQPGETVEIKESLRSGGGSGSGSSISSGSSTSLSKLISTSTSSTPNPLTALESNSRRCSRWQFECKSSGECIAIYNACDGIPNCEDGSDESPELHCPSVIGANPISQTQWKSQSPPNQQQHQQPVNSGAAEKASEPVSGGNPHQVANSPVFQSQQGLQQIYPVGNEAPLSQKNEHIFNHKNAGIMDPGYGNQLQQQKQHDAANNPYWKQQPYDYGGEQLPSGNLNVFGPGTNYGGQQHPSRAYENSGAASSPNFQSGGSNFQYQNNGLSYQPGQPFQPPQRGQYVPINNNPGQGQSQQTFLPGGSEISQQSNPQSVGGGHMKDPTTNSVLPPKTSNQGGLPSPAAVPNENQPASASGAVAASSSTSAPSLEKESEVKATIPVKDKPSGKVDPETKMEDEILARIKSQPFSSQSVDVQMEEMSPHGAGPGAFILLIIGVAMSIVMAIVIGCRLRRISLGHGRRRRKNRLDSDYLVDGMYL